MRTGRWIAFLLAAISFGMVGGCGSVETRSSEPGQDPSTSVQSTETPTSTETTTAPSAVEEMSVFSRSRTEADALPGDLSYRLKGNRCNDWERAHGGCLGDPIGEESRLLLSGLGVGDTSLYAWPTTGGGVCWAWDEGAGGCLHDFAHGGKVAYMGIDPDDEGIGAPGTLVGVIPDEVMAASVQIRGVTRPAIVHSNGIFYELPDGSCTNWAFESLTASYRDGNSETIPITWHHGPSDLPESCAA